MVSRKPIDINDKWIFIFLYPFIAFSIVHVGNDNSLSQLLGIPSYYSDIILSFTCTYAIGWYLRKLFYRLEQRFEEESQKKERIVYQILLGLIGPTILIIGVELIYLFIIGVDWKSSSIFYLELPLVFMFLVLINLIYFLLYRQKYALGLQETISEQQRSKDNYFVVKSGTATFNIPQEAVAYFYSENKISFLVCTDGKKYIYDISLKELIKQLPSTDFFQINRQMIARRSSLVKFSQTATRRIKIELQPTVEWDIYVSKTRSAEFFSWLNNH